MIALPYVPTGTWWGRLQDVWQTVRFNWTARATETDDDADFYDDIERLLH